MIVCPQCGKSFPESEAFCGFCGCAAPKVEPPPPKSTPDETSNPYAVGARTTNSSLPRDSESRDVPSDTIGAIKLCFKQGGVKGRSSRAEFWFWFLFVFWTVVCPIVGVVLTEWDSPDGGSGPGFLIILAAFLWGIVCAGPSLTVTVRRFHDVNLAAIPAYILLLDIVLFVLLWYYGLPWRVSKIVATLILIAFPLVAGICLLAILIVALLPGTKGLNRYGPQPINRAAVAGGEAKDNEVSQ